MLVNFIEKLFIEQEEGLFTNYKRYIPLVSNISVNQLRVICILFSYPRQKQNNQLFRKLVSDTIINYISTSWLMPSGMIILKNAIPGYNNHLKVATKDMKFGLNNIYYYYQTINNSKKVHQEIQSRNLETFDKTNIESKVHKVKTNLDMFEEPKKQVHTVNNSLKKLGECKKHIGPTNEKYIKATNTTDDW